jgi:hypothetical protein
MYRDELPQETPLQALEEQIQALEKSPDPEEARANEKSPSRDYTAGDPGKMSATDMCGLESKSYTCGTEKAGSALGLTTCHTQF